MLPHYTLPELSLLFFFLRFPELDLLVPELDLVDIHSVHKCLSYRKLSFNILG
jgi:hypothetical protein